MSATESAHLVAHIALADLELHRAWIVYPGTERYALADRAEALPLTQVFEVFTSR